MITLRKGSLLYKAFMLPLSHEEQWRNENETTICTMFWTLVLRLPALLLLMIVMGPPILIMMGIFSVAERVVDKVKYKRKYKGPSKAHLFLETLKGRLCLIIKFESTDKISKN